MLKAASTVSEEVFSDRKGSRFRSQLADFSSGCDPVQFRKADIKENQIRLVCLGFPDRFESMGGLPDDLKLGPLLQHRTHQSPDSVQSHRPQDFTSRHCESLLHIECRTGVQPAQREAHDTVSLLPCAKWRVFKGNVNRDLCPDCQALFNGTREGQLLPSSRSFSVTFFFAYMAKRYER